MDMINNKANLSTMQGLYLFYGDRVIRYTVELEEWQNLSKYLSPFTDIDIHALDVYIISDIKISTSIQVFSANNTTLYYYYP